MEPSRSLDKLWLYQPKEDDVASNDKSVRVSNCPIKLEVCYGSCFWRKGDRCIFRSQRGRRIAPGKEEKNSQYTLMAEEEE